ncbi:unnamed protein product, partial [Nesidiocoris tenuis]
MLSLPSEYNIVITALDTLPDVTMDFVRSRLLDEELKLRIGRTARQGQADDEVTFKASSLNPQFRRCYICQDRSHFMDRCPHRQRGRGRGFRGGGRQRSDQPRRETAHLSNDVLFVALQCEILSNEKLFILDSGASNHLVRSELEPFMSDVKPLSHIVAIKIANGEKIMASKTGCLRVFCQNRVVRVEALIVSGLRHNLLSASKLASRGCRIIIEKDQALLCNEDFTIACENVSGLYILKFDFLGENCHLGETSQIWHRRLGHTNFENLKKLGLPNSHGEKCSPCVEGKSKRTPFRPVNQKTHHIGELIHSDLCGPITPASINDERYYQVILDDYSHFAVVKLLKTKEEAADNLINYIRELETQHGTKVKRLRCDRGGEFTSTYLRNFSKKRGIKMEFSISYNPPMNGKSEKLVGVLMGMARTKIIDSGMPKFMWGEAIRCSAYELNRVPTSALPDWKTPSMIWNGRNDISKMRIFGCRAWSVTLPRDNKLNPRARRGVFVGYCGGGHRIWFPETNEILRSRHMTFDENVMECKAAETMKNLQLPAQEESTPEPDECDKNEADAETPVGDEEVPVVSRRVRKPPSYLDDYDLYTAYCMIAENEDPISFNEAINEEDWKEAITRELESFNKLNTWTPTALPPGRRAIDTRWVFRTKEDGTKRARLVAKGFQQPTEEFVYSPVCRMSTVRVLLSQAVLNDWPLRQFDVPTAFLNGILEDEVYIKYPDGVKRDGDKVLKLNRALYGLKNSPKCWNDHFSRVVENLGLRRSKFDFCLYVGKDVYLVLFVDDGIITGRKESVEKLIGYLQEEFRVKNLGDISVFLGMTFQRDRDRLLIKQTNFIDRLLETFKMTECNPIATPMEVNFADTGEQLSYDVPYRKLICSLMYLAITSRPDLSFSVSYLSRTLDKPSVPTWKAAKRILRYLKKTRDFSLIFGKDSKHIVGYSDADWAGDRSSRKSVSGFVAFYGGNAITWYSRRQNCVALSTAESEYVAGATAAQELMNIK